MRNHKLRFYGHGDGLRRYAAGPEYRNFPRTNGAWFPKIRMIDVLDPDGGWVPHMNGSAMDVGHTACDLDGTDGVLHLHGAHRNNSWSMEDAGGDAFAVRNIHGNVVPFRDVAYFKARVKERSFKGKAAAEKKGDKVITPILFKGGHFFCHLAVTIDAVFGNVIAQVGTGRGKARLGVSHFRYIKDGARFGIACCKRRKSKARSLGKMTRFA